MRDAPLRMRAERLFADAAGRTARRASLAPLHEELNSSLARFGEPMRLALIGPVSAGKSTTVNALLGERLVATGRRELTYNVNWLRHGSPPRLVVHFKDGRGPEERSLEELEALTRRPEEDKELLSAIAHIEVSHENELLRTFNIVDTPGLGSAFGTDAENTLRFLGLREEDIDRATTAEARGADAIVFLFSRSLHERDDHLLEQFHGAALGELTPINAIAVLTRTEQAWDPTSHDRDPMDVARRVARRLADDPVARRAFFTVLPVATLAALGAQLLTPPDIALLETLAELPDEQLRRQVGGEERFLRAGDEPRREPLLDLLGLYGIWLGVRLVRDGCTPDQLRDGLLQASGLQQLRELLVTHFGHRAFVIKLDTALRRSLTACRRVGAHAEGDDREALSWVAGELEAIIADEPVFRRLRVLCDYYDGALDLTDDEVADLLHVTGEHGASVADRLGVEVPAADLLEPAARRAEERLRHWRLRASTGGGGTLLAAADEISLAYVELADQLREAQELLDGG